MVKKNPSPWVFVLGFVGAAAFVALALLAVRLLWAWIVPDLLPGAAEEGLVAEGISWWTAFKVLVVLAVLTALFRSGAARK